MTTVIPNFVKKHLKFVCISDTHGTLTELFAKNVPEGDVLLHAGDFTLKGSPREVHSFNKVLSAFPHPVKVVIAGNHETCLDKEQWMPSSKKDYKEKTEYLEKNFGVKTPRQLLSNCIYLQDEAVEVSGIKIYGSPWSPRYYSDAFARDRGSKIRKEWDKIPADTDILMTHCPPNGICDIIKNGTHAGCEELIDVVQNYVKPKFHVFGHIHEGHGMDSDGVTTFINASTCTRKYEPKNRPIVFGIANPLYNPESQSELQNGELEDSLKALKTS